MALNPLDKSPLPPLPINKEWEKEIEHRRALEVERAKHASPWADFAFWAVGLVLVWGPFWKK